MLKAALLVLLVAVVWSGSARGGNTKSPLQSVVEAERAFAKMSVDKNHREAFLANFAADGKLLRPGAVVAKTWIAEHEKWGTAGLLTWDPSFAYVTPEGDLAYTTGPWEFRQERDLATKAVAFGYFITIWKHEPSGWKVEFDHGSSNPEPASPVAPFAATGSAVAVWSKKGAAVDPKQLDAEFTKALASDGAAKAYGAYLRDDARLHREGQYPVLGKSGIVAAVASDPTGIVFVPAGGGVSASGDLAYVFGTIGENGSYFRIWRNSPDGWRIALDLTSPPQPNAS